MAIILWLLHQVLEKCYTNKILVLTKDGTVGVVGECGGFGGGL